MTEIVLVGLNHKTAQIELRECLAFDGQQAVDALSSLAGCAAVNEVVLVSTCNRVEVIMAAADGRQASCQARRYLADAKQVSMGELAQALYVKTGDDAVRHLFRVAASLDSMVVGEPQILGQIKAAYLNAHHKKTSGVVLNRLFHRTFFVAKRIRSETGIGDHAVSISYAAIELGRKIFGALAGKNVLLIGAGEMAELAVEHLIRHRAGHISVANRTFAHAVTLAQRFGGAALAFDEIGHALTTADIVISSTGATQFVLNRQQVRQCLRNRRNRPIFFIDIAVPRDIDPKINRLDNCYVYDIDDLRGVIDENVRDRQREARKAERIVDEAVIRFRQWFDGLGVVPTIKSLRRKVAAIAENEIEKTLRAMPELSADQQRSIQRMSDAMVNKILHDPTLFLKRSGCHDSRLRYLDAARKLFNLDV